MCYDRLRTSRTYHCDHALDRVFRVDKCECVLCLEYTERSGKSVFAVVRDERDRSIRIQL